MLTQLLRRSFAMRVAILPAVACALFLALCSCSSSPPSGAGLPTIDVAQVQTEIARSLLPTRTPAADAASGTPTPIPAETEPPLTNPHRVPVVSLDQAFDNQEALDQLFSTGTATAGFKPDWGTFPERQSSQAGPPDNNMGGRPYRPVIGVDSHGYKSLELDVYPLRDEERTPETTRLIADSNGVFMHSSAMNLALSSDYRRIHIAYDIQQPETTGISNVWGSVWLVPDPNILKEQHVKDDEINRILYREKIEFDLSEFVADYRHQGATILMVVAHDHTKPANPSWIISMADFKQKLGALSPQGLPPGLAGYAPGDWIHVETEFDYQTNQVTIYYGGKAVLNTLTDVQNSPRLQATTVEGGRPVNIGFNLVISLVAGSAADGWPGNPVVDPRVSDPHGEMFLKNLQVVASR